MDSPGQIPGVLVYFGMMDRIKRIARAIDPDHWPDSAAEDLAYWLSRPPEERVAFGRRLVRDAYRRVRGCSPPPMNRVGRVFRPEP